MRINIFKNTVWLQLYSPLNEKKQNSANVAATSIVTIISIKFCQSCCC